MFYSFKSKFLSVALAFFISVSSFTTSTVFASSTENSDLAQNLGWSIENGILTINQHFLMDDYNTSDKKCPWYARKDEITKVKFDKDTLPDKIGSFLFYDCKNLTEIDISADKNLKSIAKDAFSGCNNLKIIYLSGTFESKFCDVESDDLCKYYGIVPSCEIYFIRKSFIRDTNFTINTLHKKFDEINEKIKIYELKVEKFKKWIEDICKELNLELGREYEIFILHLDKKYKISQEDIQLLKQIYKTKKKKLRFLKSEMGKFLEYFKEQNGANNSKDYKQ